MNSSHLIIVSLLLLLLLAFSSAIHDTTSDGVYLQLLNKKQQALYVGVRSFFYQLARFICQGGLIILAGWWTIKHGISDAWQNIFLLLAISTLLLTVYHYLILPNQADALSVKTKTSWHEVFIVWREFCKLPYATNFTIFLLIYNYPETQLIKITPLFLLDLHTHHGLQLNMGTVGFILGTAGVLSMMMGVMLSGWLMSRFSLRSTLPTITLLVVLTNLGYCWMSHALPQHLLMTYIVIMIAQFGFGLGNGAYMVYLLRKMSPSRYSMSHYAIGTSIMAIGMVLAGAMSGYLQKMLGYNGFFLWIIVIGFILYLYTLYTVKHDETLSI